MSTTPEITREEAQKWVDSRVWANGWNVNADKSIDAVEFVTQYERNKPLWDKLFKYLAETDPMTLEPGKVVLEEGRLWINVLEYTPKSAAETKTESHEKFIDLQYTYEGNEVMGLAHKVTPVTNMTPSRTAHSMLSKATWITLRRLLTVSSSISRRICTSPP